MIGICVEGTKPHHVTDEEQVDQRSCPDIATAHILMHFGRSNTLKDLRGYGLYENNNRAFSENEIEQAIDLASRVRRMLEKSWVPSRSNCGGNMPENIAFDLDGKRLA